VEAILHAWPIFLASTMKLKPVYNLPPARTFAGLTAQGRHMFQRGTFMRALSSSFIAVVAEARSPLFIMEQSATKFALSHV